MPQLTQALATVGLAVYGTLLVALVAHQRRLRPELLYVAALAAGAGCILLLSRWPAPAFSVLLAVYLLAVVALFLHIMAVGARPWARGLRLAVPAVGLLLALGSPEYVTGITVRPSGIAFQPSPLIAVPLAFAFAVAIYCVWVLDRTARSITDPQQELSHRALAVGMSCLMVGGLLDIVAWNSAMPFLSLALVLSGLVLGYAHAHRAVWRADRQLRWLTNALLALGLTTLFNMLAQAIQRPPWLSESVTMSLWLPWLALLLLLTVVPRLRGAALLAVDRLLLPRDDMESRLERLDQAEHERSVHGTLLAGVSAGLADGADLKPTLASAIAATQRALGYQRVDLLLLPPGIHVSEPGAEMEVVATAGRHFESDGHPSYRHPVGVGLVGLAAASGQPILSNDVRGDPRFFLHPGAASTRSVLSVPLRLDSEVVGVLNAESTVVDTFNANDVRTLGILADQIATTIGKARLWERLRRRADELQRLKDFSEGIIQGVQEGIVVADADGRITFANRRFEQMLGYGTGQMVGQLWQSYVSRPWQKRLTGPKDGGDRFESRLVSADGRELDVLVSSQVHWQDGRFRDTLLVFTDITERMRTEQISRMLGEAALGMQSASTRDDIYTTLRVQAERTGLHTIITLLEPGRRRMRVDFTSLPPRSVQVVERALDFKLVGLEVALRGLSFFEYPTEEGKPTFCPEGTSIVEPLLPPGSGHLAPEIARRLDIGPVMHLALHTGTQPLGVVTVSHPKLRPADEPALLLFAHQLAAALENVRLQAEMEQRAQRLAVLAETAHQLTITADIRALGELITRRLSQAYRCEAVGLYTNRDEQESLQMVAAFGFTEDERREAESTAWSRHPGWVTRHKQSLLCSDARHDPRVVYLGRGPRHDSVMCVPLLVAGNQCVGVLEVSSRAPYAYQAADLSLLSTLANQVATAVANALLVAEAETRADQLEAVSLTGQLITADLKLDDLLRHSVAEVAKLFGVPSVSIYLLNDLDQIEEAAHFPPGAEVYPVRAVELRRLTEHRRPLAISDLRDANVQPDLCLGLIERGVHSALIVPVVHKDQVKGGMLLYARDGHRAFKRESQELAGIVAGQIAVSIDNARLYEATAEAKRRTEAVVQLSFTGIITVDSEGYVREINPAAAEILGAPALDLIGQPLDAVLGIALWGDPAGPMAEVQRTGHEVHPLERTLPGRGSRSERDVLLGLAPLPDGYVISMADITRLKEIDRLKTELVANVSHELRSPLTAIKAYSELLLEGLDDDSLRRQFLKVIDSEADHLGQCISNLLDLARIQAEGYQLRPERFPLRVLIRDTVDAVSIRVAEHAIRIDVDGPEEDLWLVADRPILLSMLKNLVDNAAKFSSDGSRVIVRTTRTASGVNIDVQDFGPGIPPDQLPHIFEKFYRVRSASHSAVAGSGLGLMIARQAAQAHGGDITVQSEPGRGSTFTAHLPTSLIDDSIGQKQPTRTAA